MKAMVLRGSGSCCRPLALEELPVPRPGANELPVKVLYCGVCEEGSPTQKPGIEKMERQI